MVYHRDQAHFDRARWRKAVLVPFWLAQITLLLGLMGIFAYRLAETIRTYEENDKRGTLPTIELVWEATNVGLSTVCLILTTIEISKLAAESLTPFVMVFTHVLKTTCTLAILGLDIVVYIWRTDGHWSLTGLVIDCALVASTIAPGIYSIVTFRRLLKYDDYHHPANVKHFGFSNNELELGNGGGGSNSSSEPRATAFQQNLAPTEYPSQTARSRSHSAASATATPDSSLPTPSTLGGHILPSTDSLGTAGDRASYNHERDTQFEEYVSRRASVGLKEEIDRAMRAEFGWGSGGRTTVDRSDSVVGSGTVASARARPTGTPDVARKKSWGSERGLVSVPEEGLEEYDEYDSQASGAGTPKARPSQGGGHRRMASDDDRVMLLGHQRTQSDESAGGGQEAPPRGDVQSRKRRHS